MPQGFKLTHRTVLFLDGCVTNVCSVLMRRFHNLTIKLKLLIVMVRTICCGRLNEDINISFKYAKIDATGCFNLLLRLNDYFFKHKNTSEC
jgi:hypothetical protein